MCNRKISEIFTSIIKLKVLIIKGGSKCILKESKEFGLIKDWLNQYIHKYLDEKFLMSHKLVWIRCTSLRMLIVKIIESNKIDAYLKSG